VAANLQDGDRAAAEQAIAQARQGSRGRFQYQLRSASGVATWWDAVVTPITDADNTVVQLLVISRNITERRREDSFRAGERQVLEMIATGVPLAEVLGALARLVEQQFDHMRCTILLLDDDGVTVRHGAAPSLPAEYVAAIDGLRIGPCAGSCGTAMHRGARVVVSDIEVDPLWEDYRALAARCGVRACWSTPIFSPARQVLGSFAMYYTLPRTPNDEELRLLDTAAEIARIAVEHQRAQQALHQSEARTRAILRAIPDWMFLTSPDGVFLDYHATDASRLAVSPDEFLGRNIRQVLPPPVAGLLADSFVRVAASDEGEKVEYQLSADHDERFYEASIVRCDGDKILSIVRDVTGQKRARMEADANRRELAHMNRVATLGELSGALAHELSQPLAAVLTNAEAARRILDRDPLDTALLRDALDDVISNDKRAGAVVERLRAFLRKAEVAFQPVDLSEVVRESLGLISGELLSRRVDVAATLPARMVVRGDRVQLQQVVLNLVLNACDAISGAPPSQRHLELRTAGSPGFVEVTVSDRGPGIPEGQEERVFEPFVTFREAGLGLGLAICRSIIAAHGGSIRAENNLDGGATFRCRLPGA
jgi:signal transduction histidine kinase